MHLSLLPLTISLLASQVLADGASILAAISTISNATTSLNNTINAFPSSPLLALPDIALLLISSVTLLDDINTGTVIACQSSNLTLTETISVAEATVSLSHVVVSTLGNLMAAKGRFDKLVVVTPVVRVILRLLRDATGRFGREVVAKVPPAFQGTARGLLGSIERAFNSTIEYFDRV